MDRSVLVFSLLLILDGGRSLPVDRKRNIEAHVGDSVNNHNEKISYDTQGTYLNLLNNLFSQLLKMIMKIMNLKVNFPYMNQLRMKIF